MILQFSPADGDDGTALLNSIFKFHVKFLVPLNDFIMRNRKHQCITYCNDCIERFEVVATLCEKLFSKISKYQKCKNIKTSKYQKCSLIVNVKQIENK